LEVLNVLVVLVALLVDVTLFEFGLCGCIATPEEEEDEDEDEISLGELSLSILLRSCCSPTSKSDTL
jgi:hypothetical protein